MEVVFDGSIDQNKLYGGGVSRYDNVSKVFRGISEGRVTINQSKGLPTGTYFYVVKYSDATGAVMDKSGYLHLIND